MPRTRPAISIVLAAVLVGCAHSPAAPGGGGGPATPEAPAAGAPLPDQPLDREDYRDGNRYRVLATEELPIVGTSADSFTASNPPANLADGNLSTAWQNGGYRNPTAWAAVQLSSSATIGSIGIKTGPSAAGTSYDIQVSSDGTHWTTALANQTNATWNLETKTLPAGTTGCAVRIFWHNSATSPQAHFAIFELVVEGSAGTPSPGPTPTPTPQPSPTPTPSPTPSTMPSSGPVQALVPVAVTASSTFSGTSPQRAIDGNTSTQWTSGNYKSPSESFVMQFDQVYGFDHLLIKTGFLPAGVNYFVDASDDGTTWHNVSGPYTNTTWQLETKPLAGQGRYLRIRFDASFFALAYFSIFEVQVFGKANPTTTTVTIPVGHAYSAVYGNTVSIGGPPGQVIAVETNAFANTPRGLKFPAMLGMDHGRLGFTYQRVTPANAQFWSADLGNPGPVAFLDTAGGTGDNSGSWIFTHLDSSNNVFAVEASATANVTTWDPTRAATANLGTATRKWQVTGTYADPNALADQVPGVLLVYNHPDGTPDFTLAAGNTSSAGGFASTIETQGYVEAFFMADSPTAATSDATVTLTALN